VIAKSDLEGIKVLIIDDSAFSRHTIKGTLEKVPGVKVVGIARDGFEGMEKIMSLAPDVVTLDIEMPKMDGFSLLRWIMSERPLPVIIVSGYGDSPTVFKALELGAVDFIVKPSSRTSKEIKTIEKDLFNKLVSIRSLKMANYQKSIQRLKNIEINDSMKLSVSRNDKEYDIVAIGASTGGPTAIQTILTNLPKDFPSGIIISQHMPYGFTRHFADRIDRISSLHVKEAKHGVPVEDGKALICPGGCHMTLKKLSNKVTVHINNATQRDKYIPSVDMMMKSAAQVYGKRSLGIILTGMGHDGQEGMLEIKKRGGFTIAESEESAVIFGMPQAVISSGAAEKVIPLRKISREVLKILKKPEKKSV
jgi:two-component system chemotaxis response regulator CheB